MMYLSGREDSDANRDKMWDEITKKVEDQGGKRI